MDKANGLCDLKTLTSLLVLSIFVFFLFLVITLDGVKAQSSKFTDEQATSGNTNQSSIDKNSVNITMSRSACFGACPVYYLEIDGDGKVIYRGYKNVDVTGDRISLIPVDKSRALVNQFNSLGYFNLKDRYDEANITDQASVQTSIRIDGIFKSVHHYLGTVNSPELVKLRQLENMIDEVANSSQWVGLQGLNSSLVTS
ncbi:MAG: DUF6438 domain-containing protein [Nitrososphaeraceae archaeon]